MKILFLTVVLIFSGCAMTPPVPQMSQLEIREMQTRSYENGGVSFKQVMKAIINVLQDDGFIIKNADKELGFITAVQETDVETPWGSAFAIGFGDQQPRYPKNAINEGSVNITERGKRMQVRAIFQKKVLDNLGGTSSVHQITNLEYYQKFFSKVDKGLFLEKQGY